MLAACSEPLDIQLDPTQTIEEAESATSYLQQTERPALVEESTKVSTPTAEGIDGSPAEFEPTAPIPVSILLPTPTHPPVSNPPFQSLDWDTLPSIKNDLAFVSNTGLHLWSAQDRAIITMLEPIVDPERFAHNTFAKVNQVSFSADGGRAVVEIRYNQPADQNNDGSGDTETLVLDIKSAESDLIFLDTVSQESWVLVEGIKDQINALTISPDQTLAAFSTMPAVSNLNNGRFFFISTPANPLQQQLTQLHDCRGRCRAISWRQDSQLLAFSDESAVYVANPYSSSPDKIIQNTPLNKAKNAGDSEEFELFEPISWAPNGRALLLQRTTLTDINQMILDLPTQKILSVPQSERSANQVAPTIDWLSDSRIIVANPLTQNITTWRIQFDDGLIEPDETYALSTENRQIVTNYQQVADGRFVFAYASKDGDPQNASLYSLVSFSEQPERINGMPNIHADPQIYWGPDGSEAVQDFGRTKFLATADRSLYAFQDHIWGINWLSPGR